MVKLLNRLSLLQSKPANSPLLIELGFGGFAKVLFGYAVETREEVAIKVSSVEDSSSLWKEHLLLHRLRNEVGFTKIRFFGRQNVLELGEHVVMVMSVLGPSLDKLLQHTTLGVRGFSSLTVLKLAEQMIDRLRVISGFNIVHGDIQPGNFLMGRGACNGTVHLIDFGLSSLNTINGTDAKLFRGAFSGDLRSVEKTEEGALRGTLTFSSKGVMNGDPCTQKDDLGRTFSSDMRSVQTHDEVSPF